MNCKILVFLALFALPALPVHSRPDPAEAKPQLQDGPTPTLPFEAPMAKSLVDTTYLLGGPGSWDGSFETPEGLPDWHGWTHKDLTSPDVNHWHVSTYWAENLGGHGPGNFAMNCVDENIPACAPPDTIGGYGANWFDDLEWRHTVADIGQSVTVRLTGYMNYDLTDVDWDFLEFFIQRGNTADMLASWTGTGAAVDTLDFTTVLSPGEFSGTGGDEVRLWWRVWSDSGYNDIDCKTPGPGHGAARIDDITVTFDDSLITFDDFEPGSPVNWSPVEFAGMGDFANLRNDLGDLDPCKDNNTYQVNFVDDGLVVPGTEGTACVDWCYDPGGWIVNNTGGLLADDGREWFLDNMIISPPVPYLAGNDGAELSFDVYRHERLRYTTDAGMFYVWNVRSTASSDPTDLELAPWKGGPSLFYGGPDFKRHMESVGDLLVPNRQWVQIALRVEEAGWRWNFNGPNGTPAPYFDNVALKVWDPDGPEISVRGYDLFGDAFPETGVLNPDNLAANSCRVDMAGVTYYEDRGDSLVAEVLPLRHGAVVLQAPDLHWVMECNPTFDSVRGATPDNEGLLRGMASSTGTVYGSGTPLADHWTFDLPDNGFFFPGDRLRYYITASDDLGGEIRTSVWPPDTTGVTDFTTNSPFPRVTEIRGLPTITQPVAGQFAQPPLLFCDDTIDPLAADVWLETLEELGLVSEVDFDIVTLDRISRGIRLDKIMNLGLFAGYQTMLYARGSKEGGTLESEDAGFINNWLALGNKQAMMAGDGVGYDLTRNSYTSPLGSQLGVQFDGMDIYELNGGIRELQVSPVPGNGILPDDVQWQVYDGCPTIRFSNAVSATGTGQAGATLDPQGTTGGAYAALVTVDDQVLGNRTVVMPFDLDRVDGLTVVSAKNGTAFSQRAGLLNFLLFWLGADVASPVDDVPGVGQVSVTAHPNPFNPQTTIAFDLPRAAAVSLDIFDLQGRLVRKLLDENPHTAGSHKQVWNGRDADGQATASGLYFYRFTAGDQKRVGKLTLLK